MEEEKQTKQKRYFEDFEEETDYPDFESDLGVPFTRFTEGSIWD